MPPDKIILRELRTIKKHIVKLELQLKLLTYDKLYNEGPEESSENPKINTTKLKIKNKYIG